MEIKEIKIEDNCLAIICEDRYVTFGLKDITSIDKFIQKLKYADYTLNNLKK